ncbi:hypothetical protein [Corynebacterium sp. S7]
MQETIVPKKQLTDKERRAHALEVKRRLERRGKAAKRYWGRDYTANGFNIYAS